MELVLPFLSDDPAFCHGFETGTLYLKMTQGEPCIEGYFHRANDEQFFLMASRLGYRTEWEPVDETWFWAKFTV